MDNGLKDALEAAACLCGQRDQKLSSSLQNESEQEGLLEARLRSRIDAYRYRIGMADKKEVATRAETRVAGTLREVERETGSCALEALCAIYNVSRVGRATVQDESARKLEGSTSASSSSSSSMPLVGARDLALLRTLISLVTQWHLLPLLASYDSCLACLARQVGVEEAKSTSKGQNLPDKTELRQRRGEQRDNLQKETRASLSAVLILESMLPIASTTTQTGNENGRHEIGNAVLKYCASHILALAIRVGWGPKVRSTTDVYGDSPPVEPSEQGRSVVVNLINSLSITSALRVLSGVTELAARKASPLPAFVKATTSMLVAAQLLRPDAVLALLRHTFGADFDGDVENGANTLFKMQGVAKLLSTPPNGMDAEPFISLMIPQLMGVLSELPFPHFGSVAMRELAASRQSTPMQKKASTFVLARLAETHPDVLKASLEKQVWGALIPTPPDKAAIAVEEEMTIATGPRCISRAIDLLDQMLQYAEPSSTFISLLVLPVVVPLFTFVAFIKKKDAHSKQPQCGVVLSSREEEEEKKKEKGKSSATTVKEQMCSAASRILQTWLRLAEAEEVLSRLGPGRDSIFALAGLGMAEAVTGSDTLHFTMGEVIEADLKSSWFATKEGVGIQWARIAVQDNTANVFANLSLESQIQSSLGSDEDEEDLANKLSSMLNLQPDAELLADLLKRCVRQDVAASLLISLLDRYTASKSDEQYGNTVASLSSVLYLQHLNQIIKVFGPQLIERQHEKILVFINFTLDAATGMSSLRPSSDQDGSTTAGESKLESTSGLEALLDIGKTTFFEGKEGVGSGSGLDLDDTASEQDEELANIALNLLLSLLERHPSMSKETTPLLKVIDNRLEKCMPFFVHSSITPLVSEVRLILTARSSATKHEEKSRQASRSSAGPQEEAFARGRSMYQEALKLLQDPILPVRAHGLVLLTKLVSSGSRTISSSQDADAISFDEALSPAILDIFLQAILDDDSYLYLNAIKGLAEMAKRGGNPIFRRLLDLYIADTSSLTTSMGQLEADRRLRVGEALLQVIQHLDEAFKAHISDVVPLLMGALRNRTISATIRSSVVSLLGTCVEAAPTAMASQGYSHLLADAMLDLASIESVERPAVSATSRGTEADSESDQHLDAKQQERQRKFAPGHDDATDIDAKLPQLRRSALLLVSLLIRGTRHQLEQAARKIEPQASGTDSLRALRLPGGRILRASSTELVGDNDDKTVVLLFPRKLIGRAKTVCGFLQWRDTDAIVRMEGQDCLEQLDGLELDLVHRDLSYA